MDPLFPRDALVRRIDDILAAPRVGNLARKLRKRAELSLDQLGQLMDVEPEHLHNAEKYDDVSYVAGDAIMEGEDTTDEIEAKVTRYIAALSPSDDEKEALRYDLRTTTAELFDDLRDYCGPPSDEQVVSSTDRVEEFQDPWEVTPKTKSRRKKRCRPKTPAVSAFKTIGVAPERLQNIETGGFPATAKKAKSVTVRLQMVTTIDGREVTASNLMTINKEYESMEDIGLTLQEAKSILHSLQSHVVERQAAAYVRAHSRCEHCHQKLGLKDLRTIRYRTLFGRIALQGDRYRTCSCAPNEHKTHTPLATLLTERTSPEMVFLEAKLAALAPYGISAKLLKEFLPVDAKLSSSTVWRHAMDVGQRCDDIATNAKENLGPEAPGDNAAPKTLTVGIDGGYLKHWHEKSGRFEVIVGKSVNEDGAAKCFGGVHRYDSDPRGRLARVLLSQGYQSGDSVRFLSDGEKVVRGLQKFMVPESTHVLDWFHIAMRFTGLKQFIRGLVRLEKENASYSRESAAYEAQRLLDSAKWRLWHGRIEDALARLGDLSFEVGVFEETYPRYEKLQTTLEEVINYLDRNRDFIVNYSQDHRAGRAISTSFIESMVNALIGKRFSKKQHMQWTPKGAHLLLQLRVQVSNGELWNQFCNWYPKLPPKSPPAGASFAANDVVAPTLRLVA